jgi:hypothetical protein
MLWGDEMGLGKKPGYGTAIPQSIGGNTGGQSGGAGMIAALREIAMRPVPSRRKSDAAAQSGSATPPSPGLRLAAASAVEATAVAAEKTIWKHVYVLSRIDLIFGFVHLSISSPWWCAYRSDGNSERMAIQKIQ